MDNTQALESRVASLEQKLETLRLQTQNSAGPTTNYNPVRQDYSGANVNDGLSSAGAGGSLAGGHVTEVRKQSDGSLLLWIGYSIDGAGGLHQGMHILSLDGVGPATGGVYGLPEQAILNAILTALKA